MEDEEQILDMQNWNNLWYLFIVTFVERDLHIIINLPHIFTRGVKMKVKGSD